MPIKRWRSTFRSIQGRFIRLELDMAGLDVVSEPEGGAIGCENEALLSGGRASMRVCPASARSDTKPELLALR
jgi:hypothetical protein